MKSIQEIKSIIEDAYRNPPEKIVAMILFEKGYDESDLKAKDIEDHIRIPIMNEMRNLRLMKCENKRCPDYKVGVGGNCLWRGGYYYRCVDFKKGL